MSNKRSVDPFCDKATLAVDLRPLGVADLAVVQHLLGEIAPQWSAELQGYCDDEAVLALVPEDGDDEIGPSFVISRETLGLRVDQVHWDVVTEIGTFPSLNEVMRTIRLRLLVCAGGPAPVSYSLH
jgi:hypothetical protein